jgi:hypothetical protein
MAQSQSQEMKLCYGVHNVTNCDGNSVTQYMAGVRTLDDDLV